MFFVGIRCSFGLIQFFKIQIIQGCPCTGKILADILAAIVFKGVVLNIKSLDEQLSMSAILSSLFNVVWLFLSIVLRYCTVIPTFSVSCYCVSFLSFRSEAIFALVFFLSKLIVLPQNLIYFFNWYYTPKIKKI